MVRKKAYKRHENSEPRQSLKRVRGGLRKCQDEGSRLKVRRSEQIENMPVNQEIVADNSKATQNTQQRTCMRVKPRISLEATYSAPSTSTVIAEPVNDPLKMDWPQAEPETVANKCLSAISGYRIVSGKDLAEPCADDGDSGLVEEPRVCRVCLALDVKMYNLKDIELRKMFQNITGIVVTENNHSMLERLCWECAGRLKAAAAFRNKALLSDALLLGLANTSEQIRKNDVTLIKENQDYLKSAGTLSLVEVFHTVQIDAEYESVPSVLENNDTDIVQNTVRKDSIELNKSIEQENNGQMDVEDESMIEFPIKTEIENDPICPTTGHENINNPLETNPLFTNNIPLREDTSNSPCSSPPAVCSHVETKYPTLGYLLKTPSDCENKKNKTIVKMTNRELISMCQCVEGARCTRAIYSISEPNSRVSNTE